MGRRWCIKVLNGRGRSAHTRHNRWHVHLEHRDRERATAREGRYRRPHAHPDNFGLLELDESFLFYCLALPTILLAMLRLLLLNEVFCDTINERHATRAYPTGLRHATPSDPATAYLYVYGTLMRRSSRLEPFFTSTSTSANSLHRPTKIWLKYVKMSPLAT